MNVNVNVPPGRAPIGMQNPNSLDQQVEEEEWEGEWEGEGQEKQQQASVGYVCVPRFISFRYSQMRVCSIA